MSVSLSQQFLGFVLPPGGPLVLADPMPQEARLIVDLRYSGFPEGMAPPGCSTDVVIGPLQIYDEELWKALRQAAVRTVWMEHVTDGEEKRFLEVLIHKASEFQCIPITGSPELLSCLDSIDPLVATGVALKGSDASGFCGRETLTILFDIAASKHKTLCSRVPLIAWGGVALPEAAAAFLALGAGGVVFESVHLLTSAVNVSPVTASRLAAMDVSHTSLLQGTCGVQFRAYDKGNCRAVRLVRKELAGTPDTWAAIRMLTQKAVDACHSDLEVDRLVPLGPEAAFAGYFAARYGTDFEQAVRGFSYDVRKASACSSEAANLFQHSSAATFLKTRYPIIQGAMTWITDQPELAKRVAAAGGLPTLALGPRSISDLRRDFGFAADGLSEIPYAVNILALEENPHLEDQLSWISEVRPPYVTIAAGDPSYIGRIRAMGLKAIYVTSEPALGSIALRHGAEVIVFEGCEAGGHIGTLSTLILAQALLRQKTQNPEQFGNTLVFLAGGFHDRRSSFRAAMLGADGLQLGTAYLACRDIVDSGALTPLYQQLILQSSPGDTTVSGESIGLRVRSLHTQCIKSIEALEYEFQAGALDEKAFRLRLEEIGAGSLLIAAKGMSRAGELLEDHCCLADGQFMSGAVAGVLDKLRSIAELHRELIAGPLKPLVPERNMQIPQRAHASNSRRSRQKEDRVVITGMAMANALGDDVSTIWDRSCNLLSGVRPIPPKRWDHSRIFDPVPGRTGKAYCSVGAFHEFNPDRKELGIPPHDFRTMTHSTRLTLWLAAKALQDSGLLESARQPERVGVVISQNSGEMGGTLTDLVVFIQAEELVEDLQEIFQLDSDRFQSAVEHLRKNRVGVDDTTLLGRLNSSAGGFICNRYGFKGPSFAVSAACATGLVALWCAYRMIRAGILDAAVIGGGEEQVHPGTFLEFSALQALAGASGMPSEQQNCRPFDRTRDGFVLGEGGAVIILERESRARDRGAPIKAVLAGMGASNNDQGMVESGSHSQVIAIRSAFADADVRPEDVGLVECHATATVQGDIEEVAALKAVFARGSNTVLSAFKSQVGHTLGASGLMSLIRGVCAMHHGTFPPTLNYQSPDPAIGLEEWGFRIPARPEVWARQNGAPRRFLANAFGFGGANYVALLEEDGTCAPPQPKPDRGSQPANALELLPGLHFLMLHEGDSLTRVAVIADSLHESLEKARRHGSQWLSAGMTPSGMRQLEREGVFVEREFKGALALVFPGQGSAVANMGQQLYAGIAAIRMRMEHLARVLGGDILERMFSATEDEIRDSRLQQPVLFIYEYALASLLLDVGLKPDVLAGHSLGELTALCLAGVFSPEDGLRLVNKRAECMSSAAEESSDPGSMIAIEASKAEVESIIQKFPGIYITNLNSPLQTVIGGSQPCLQPVLRQLEAGRRRFVHLNVAMAFHSPLMLVIRPEMKRFLDGIPFHPPKIPVISNTTRQPYPDDPEAIKAIVMDHLESPVHWLDNVRALWRDYGARLFVEAGPKDTLCSLVMDSVNGALCLPVCRTHNGMKELLAAAGELFALGRINPRAEHLILDRAAVQVPLDRAAAERIVQREISRFALEGVERYFKPNLLQILRRELQTDISHDTVEALLAEAMGVGLPLPARVESSSSGDSITPSRSTEVQPLRAQPAVRHERPEATSDPVLECVIRIIMGATGFERDEIEPDMDIRADLAIRSSRLPVIMDLAEQNFGISLGIADFINVKTVGDIARTIERLLKKEGKEPPRPEDISITPNLNAVSPVQSAHVEIARSPISRFLLSHVPLQRNPKAFRPMDTGELVLVVDEAEAPPLAEAVRSVMLRKPFAAKRAISISGSWQAGTRFPEKASALVFIFGDDESAFGGSKAIADYFELIKEFLSSPERRLVLCVAPARSIRAQALLGIFLAAQLEYEDVRFRWVSVHDRTKLVESLRCALDSSNPLVALIAAEEGILAEAAVEAEASLSNPARLQIGPDDVILVSGGGRGLTSQIAGFLGPQRATFVLLGRTPLVSDSEDNSDQQQASEIRAAIAFLESQGARACYHVCDVRRAEEVKAVADAVRASHGPITGVIHGAGVLRDGFLAITTGEDFREVVAVKADGAENLIAATAHQGLRFFVALSSLAAVQGNPGQVAYCAANRAMAASVRRLHQDMPGIRCKTLWLPPVEGTGMTADPEVRDLLRLRGLDEVFLHPQEAAVFTALEVCSAADDLPWILPARKIPMVPTMYPAAPPTQLNPRALLGFAPSPDTLPLVSAFQNDAEMTRIQCKATASIATNPWLEDHRPFQQMSAPLFSGIMAIEMFLEAAWLLRPMLQPTGVSDVRFFSAVVVPPGLSVPLRCSAVMDKACEEGLRVQTFVESGTENEMRWSKCYTGSVWLSPKAARPVIPPDFTVDPAAFDTRPMPNDEVNWYYTQNTGFGQRYRVLEKLDGTTPETISGVVIYRKTSDQEMGTSNYLYSPYILEAFMHLASFHLLMRDRSETRKLIPVSMDSVQFGRQAEDGEDLYVAARISSSDEGLFVDAVARSKDGEVLMAARGILLQWYNG